MLKYKKIIYIYSGVCSTRMIIGAISVIYMLTHKVSFIQLGFIKSFQALIIICLGILIGFISDKTNRKNLFILVIVFSLVNLLLLYIAGLNNNLILFYFAEFFNALSLVFDQSNSRSYILDQYTIDTSNKNFEIPLGEVDLYSFLGMSICSITGGLLYKYVGINTFLVATVTMTIITIISYLILPNQVHISQYIGKIYNKNTIFIHIKLILRKYKQYFLFIVGYLLINLIFQILIQYWQPLATKLSIVNKNVSYLGFFMFCIMLVQSFSGKMTKHCSCKAIAWICGTICLVFSLYLWYMSINLNNAIFLLIGMSLTFGCCRYIITITNAYIHKNVHSKFRAKYDSILNTTLRLVTAISIIGVGILAKDYNLTIILLSCIIVSIVLLLCFILAIFMRQFRF